MAESEPLPQVKIPFTMLNNGLSMPVLGYGTWMGLDDKLEFNYCDVPKLPEVLSYAIDVGYRHIDTAHLYSREDLFITTKVWQHNHCPADVVKSCCDSLRRLGLEYVDQILMHWPMAIDQNGCDMKIDYIDTWKGFEQVYDMKLARSIGVSNFNVDQLDRLLKCCRIKPQVNQVEINFNLGQKCLVDYCQTNGIVVVAYSPFGTMIPSRNFPNSPDPKIDNSILKQIARSHNKTVPQIALRYLVSMIPNLIQNVQ
ncbi:aldo/keto reductase family domain-containing protein [Phthorimaea operculella]|nr:aldo/keto reductase family domain-containing protein [Phthorimaea operculella]